ncbi:hypothetical protein N7537_003604 [Penicillium hordei]|uniref:NAD(P)-binding domain-containing protein n=1 Tax=Penicillium hordei TaxID=40994 RepID=A0AAD6EAT6_9EURO|nr:uncharacterized protein N7537_003604 [Penicillium hordei]KAJ5606985.1 hypothetical protein N7537_003604 [Penicillium hordei]
MHILVLGASGAIGCLFCDIALNEGHHLTLFVRNASKVPEHLRLSEGTEIIVGTLEADLDLEVAAKCGADIISFAGPAFRAQGTPLTDAYKLLIPKLASQNIPRILILCTPSFRDESDIITSTWWAGKWFMKLFSPGQYQEMVGVGEAISSLPDTDGLQWGLFRVGGLTNGKEAPVNATYLGSGVDNTWIIRASVARWVLDEAVEGKAVGKMPYICNK